MKKRMIVLLIFLLTFITFPSYASDWKYVTTSIDQEKYYIDLESIKITPPVVTFWHKEVKEDIEKEDKEKDNQSKGFFPLKGKEEFKARGSINCKEETSAPRDLVKYKSDGSIDSSYSRTEKELLWTGIVPDSVMHAFMKALCVNAKPRPLQESKMFIKYCPERKCSKLSRQKDQILIYDANNDLLIKGKLNASGKEEGKWTFFRVVGDRKEVNFKNGKKDGITTVWIGKWKIIETTFKNDVNHGKTTTWESDGRKSESFYEDGFLHGTARRYDKMGKKVSEGNYSYGKLNGPLKKWFSNGKMEIIGTFKEDKLHGTLIYYYENGNKKYEMNFLDGEPHGLFTHWDEKGNKIASEDAPPMPEWAKEAVPGLSNFIQAPAPAPTPAPE